MLMVLMAALLPRGACVATRALAPAFNGDRDGIEAGTGG